MAAAAGRLAGLLVDRRTAGRDLGAVVLGREMADFGLAAVALGLATDLAVEFGVAVVLALAALALDRAVLLDLDAGLDFGRADDPDGLRLAAVLRLDAAVATVRTEAGFAADIVLAAAVSAFAAVVMALVAVFIACMADDMVLADAVALVAAAVILLAADVTLVAADDTVLAADAGVAELRLAVLLRAAPLRVDRAALEREAVERDADDRDAVLRVDRDALLRLVVFPAVLRADLAAVLPVALGVALDVVLDMDFGRLAVPLDALRLTDLLRAVLAELRRVAARVVD
jgi:hypothetical protein